MTNYHPSAHKRCIITTAKASAKKWPDEEASTVILRFDDFDEALTVATPCRLTLLKIIREQKPESLYELALLIDKNQAYVYREAKILKDFGMIGLDQSNEVGRKKVRPVSLFDEIVLWF